MPNITTDINTGSYNKIFSDIYYKLENAAKLDVAGDLNIKGNTLICGELRADKIIIEEDNDIDISGNLSVQGNVSFVNNVDIGSNLDVSGNISSCGYLQVDAISEKTSMIGLSILNSMSVDGDIDIESDVEVGGNTYLCGELRVDNIHEKTAGLAGISLHNNTNVIGVLCVQQNLQTDFIRERILDNGITFQSNAIFENNVDISGGICIDYIKDRDGSGIVIDGNVDISGNICANNIETTYIKDKDGSGIVIDGNVDISGNICANNIETTYIKDKDGSGIVIDGDIDISGGIVIPYIVIDQQTGNNTDVSGNGPRGIINMVDVINSNTVSSFNVINEYVSPTSTILLTLANNITDSSGNSQVGITLMAVVDVSGGQFTIHISNSGANSTVAPSIHFMIVG
jgi:hypothetical protein